MRIAKPVQLSSDDDRRLRILSNRKRIEARFQMRTRIVLLAAKGMSDKDPPPPAAPRLTSFGAASDKRFSLGLEFNKL